MHHSRRIVAIVLLAGVGSILTAAAAPITAPQPYSATSWKNDPAWHQGKAEFALYDAVRPIYGRDRTYEARIFTNKQHLDPATTTKAEDWNAPDAIEVFKHNVSEIIPTENYVYRFLTTSFVRTDTLQPYKVVASTQEDCGATYKQFVVENGQLDAASFCYFPGAGSEQRTERIPGRIENFTFHDCLTLRLRDYPFDAHEHMPLKLKLVPDQTDTHETSIEVEEATVTFVGRETIEVPYGRLDTHHLRVEHAPDGGTRESHYWFAADPGHRRVLVKYAGPYGVRYELRKLAWWAYWDRSRPEPE